MAIDNFKPTIWSAMLLGNLHKTLVYGQSGIVNRTYEGEIKQKGDTVKITSIGPVTITSYTKNTDHAAPEALDDASTILQITQSEMFNLQVDDIDAAQAAGDVMNDAMAESGYALADVADQFIAALYSQAATANLIGSTASPKTDLGTLGQAYKYLLMLKTRLDEANVPKDGRWCILPPWYEELLLDDEKFVSFGTVQNRENLANGEVGRAAGFRILTSNNVPNTASEKYRIMAGYPGAISYAEQINKLVAYRPELRFADAVKGLHTYGAKVVRPAGLAVLTANRPE